MVPLSALRPLSHLTGLTKRMETEQSPLKHVNVHFLYGSVDIRQMFCSISHPINNGQEYLLAGSVRYVNPVFYNHMLPNYAGVTLSRS